MIQDNKGTVYLIPTPIAPDTAETVLPLAVKAQVQQINHYLVENIRTARRFISSLQTGRAIETLHFEVLDKNTPSEAIAALFRPVHEGHDLGILSEAGCPGIADPGALAVYYAHRQRIKVVPLAGPSAILLALMASGFSGQSFAFHGYLPIDKAERIQTLKRLEKRSRQYQQTQIFMETPYRNKALWQDMLSACQAETWICVARDITGSGEYIRSMQVKAWKQHPLEWSKVPAVFLLADYQ